MAESFDVIVIGGGPGGYVAAIRAAQLGQKTAVVEKDKPGGRCLNYACIPAKTMLHTAEVLDHAQNSRRARGQGHQGHARLEGARRAPREVSDTLSGGVEDALGQEQDHQDRGRGLAHRRRERRRSAERPTRRRAVVLATGSVAMPIPGVEFSERDRRHVGRVVASLTAEEACVVGAGASGSEIASAYVRYGTEVTLIEMLGQILPLEDKDCARVVERTFKKQGITVATGAPIENVEETAKSVKFTYGDTAGRGRLPRYRRRPRTRHRGAQPLRSRYRDRGQRQDQDRRAAAHDEQEGLRNRRPRARPGARAQSFRGRRRRGRDDRRRANPSRRRRPDPRRDLLPPAGRFGRPHRGGRRRRPGTTSRSGASSSAASVPLPSTTTARAW